MKKHSFYKRFRRVAMLSGIPALTMMFACCCKYGMPSEDMIWGQVLDKDTETPIADVEVRTDNQGQTSTDEFGCFNLFSTNCGDFVFSKEGYATKDTLLCHNVDNKIFMQKQSAE
ncbi:MAG: hypothetical protein IKI09_09610 [Bacteroidales bacterium]|nr:hypothetical protein [Bacteroidales bacterium]